MAATHDICIRGSGVVARTLALLLARERLRVALVAGQTPPAAPDVRAYALNDASRALLDSLRCWPAAQDATPVLRMEVFGDHGGAVHFDAAEQGAAALAWIVDVPALESLLADAVRFQPRIEVVSQPVEATLTVVCEGRASASREAYGVQYEVTPYEQHAIATRLRCGGRCRAMARTSSDWQPTAF
jgi:2-polyprenyl-6-methoxyphenol hydroxylase-like FAD-dependent oxidoreductase